MHSLGCASLWVALCWLADGASSVEVLINPDHFHNKKGDPVSIRCETEDATPVVDCQFRVWFVGKKEEGVLLNATLGNFEEVHNLSPKGTYSAHFTNKFDKGNCGVTLEGLPGDQLLIGCKLTTVNETAVKTTSLLQTDINLLPLVNNTQQSFVSAGEDVDISAKATDSSAELIKCTSTLPNGVGVNFDQLRGGNSWEVLSPAGARNKAPGGWLDKAECGLTIGNVQETHNGVFFVKATKNKGAGSKAVTLIVAKPPAALQMSLDVHPKEHVVGDTATASCLVHGVRAPDQLAWTWTLGGRTLRNASRGYSNPHWSWPWQEANVSQSLSFVLEDEDDEQYLGCHFGGVSKTIALKPFTVPARQKIDVAAWISSVSLFMLLAILAVAVVAFAAVQRFDCFKAQQHADNSQTAALTTSVHTDHAHRENDRSQGKQRLDPRGQRPGPTRVSVPQARPAPPTSSPLQAQAAYPGKGGHAEVKRGVHRTATPRTGQAAVGSEGVQYANAADLGRARRKPDGRKEAEYLNFSQDRGAFPKTVPQSVPVPKLPHKTTARASQLVPSEGTGQGHRAIQKVVHDPEKVSPFTEAIQHTPRPAVASQRLPSIWDKDSVDKVLYAELRLPTPTAPRIKSAAPKEEVVYAELDFQR